MRSLERVNIRPKVRTYVLTYIRTGQTLYPLHNFVVRGDNKSIANDCVIPRHCKHFHSPIFSNRFIFSAGQLNLICLDKILHISDQLL